MDIQPDFDTTKPFKMKRFIIIPFLFSFVFISCRFTSGTRINGNGKITTQSRSAGIFTGIDVSGNMDVYVKQDSVASVKIEADENLLEYIHITVNGGILEIKEERGYNLHSAKGIKVYVSGASFEHFEASGACDIYSENKIVNSHEIEVSVSGASGITMELDAPKVNADLSGASHLNLKGGTRIFTVDGSGASDIKCFDLMAEETNIEMSGAGDAEVFASLKLDVDVSGAAGVRYKGNATVTQDIRGAGSVKKME